MDEFKSLPLLAASIGDSQTSRTRATLSRIGKELLIGALYDVHIS